MVLLQSRGRSLLPIDHRAHVLSLQGAGDIPLLQTVYDLNTVEHFAVLKDLKAWALNNQIFVVTVDEGFGPYLRDELYIWILFWVIRIEPTFILDKDATAGADKVRQDDGRHRSDESGYALSRVVGRSNRKGASRALWECRPRPDLGA